MRAKLLLWIVTFAVLAFPKTSHAGILDVIWEMSGPQMLGIGLQCDFQLTGTSKPECLLFGARLGGWESRQTRAVWLNLLTAAYFSTGRDGKEDDGQQIPFSGGRARMIGVDPMLGIHLYSTGQHRFHVGTGLTVNRFFGPDIDAFTNVGIKLRPLGWDWDRGFRFWSRTWKLEAAYNLRIYPDGFDASPTGGLASTSDPEAVHGFFVGLTF